MGRSWFVLDLLMIHPFINDVKGFEKLVYKPSDMQSKILLLDILRFINDNMFMNDKPMSATERSKKRNGQLAEFALDLGMGNPSEILTTMHAAYRRGDVVIVEIFTPGFYDQKKQFCATSAELAESPPEPIAAPPAAEAVGQSAPDGAALGSAEPLASATLIERLKEYAATSRHYVNSPPTLAPGSATWSGLASLLEEAVRALENVATWRADPEKMLEREHRFAEQEAEWNAVELEPYARYVCQCLCSCMERLTVPGGVCSNCAQGDHKL